jgi:hypothetical protein
MGNYNYERTHSWTDHLPIALSFRWLERAYDLVIGLFEVEMALKCSERVCILFLVVAVGDNIPLEKETPETILQTLFD